MSVIYMLINTFLCITTTNPLLRYRFKLRPSYCKSAKAIHIVLPLSWYISLSIYILCIYLDFIAWTHSSLNSWYLFACSSIYPYTFRIIIIDAITKRSSMVTISSWVSRLRLHIMLLFWCSLCSLKW